MSNLQHADISGKVIGAAMKVHRHFGPGFQEVVYKRALVIELNNFGLQIASEVERNIMYNNHLIGKRRLDLLVEELILIELKAVTELERIFENQILNYLKIFDLEVGLLLNFGTESLQFKRFINNKKSVKSIQNP